MNNSNLQTLQSSHQSSLSSPFLHSTSFASPSSSSTSPSSSSSSSSNKSCAAPLVPQPKAFSASSAFHTVSTSGQSTPLTTNNRLNNNQITPGVGGVLQLPSPTLTGRPHVMADTIPSLPVPLSKSILGPTPLLPLRPLFDANQMTQMSHTASSFSSPQIPFGSHSLTPPSSVPSSPAFANSNSSPFLMNRARDELNGFFSPLRPSPHLALVSPSASSPSSFSLSSSQVAALQAMIGSSPLFAVRHN
jgi:hypothetical protein